MARHKKDVPLKPKSGGRFLTYKEQEAWEEYEAILDKYHELYKVRWYDRVSVHEHFPEIMTAFEKCCILSKETNELINIRFRLDD